jgi:adenylate cyclase
VGRDRQLRALGELLDEALSGRGQAVNLVGDAGMGKSRLAAEFLESAAATVRVREGRCLSFAGATPFVPIADIVRAQTGVEASASPDRLLPGILARLASLGLDTAAHAPYLARLLGAPEAADLLGDRSPESIRESTLRSLVALFSAEATESPTILLIEDLHWMDAVSEDVIQRWVEALPGRRAMVLCTSRPGFRAPWMGVSYATQLALPPLDAEASRAVVDAVVGGAAIPPVVLDRAVARATATPSSSRSWGTRSPGTPS